MSARTWTCQRQHGGERCGWKNPARKRKCELCGKTRPARKRPAHMAALDVDYSAWVELNGADRCAICQRPPSQRRRLDRDHCHATGKPRGLLCARCNRALPSWMTASWLRTAAAYLERASRHGGTSAL